MSRVSFDGQRWSNAEADRITLSEPDPHWPARFADEAGAIRAALGAGPDFRIEHFGSTAIPGLAAKPIIDLLVVPPPALPWSGLIAPLERLGYAYWADNPRRDRMFFVRGMPPYGAERTHHLHVRSATDAEAALLFRDYLIAYPAVAAQYESLKRRLAMEHPANRDDYTSAKDSFIASVLAQARQERDGPGRSSHG